MTWDLIANRVTLSRAVTAYRTLYQESVQDLSGGHVAGLTARESAYYLGSIANRGPLTAFQVADCQKTGVEMAAPSEISDYCKRLVADSLAVDRIFRR